MKKKNIKNRSQLSKETGIPYTTIVGFYEKGIENIRRSTLLKLCNFFECSLDFLVRDEVEDVDFGKYTEYPLNQPEIVHVEKYRTLNNNGKELVDYVLNTEYQRATKPQPLIDAFNYRNNPDYLEPVAAHNDAELTEEELANIKEDLEAIKKKSAELDKKKKDDDI